MVQMIQQPLPVDFERVDRIELDQLDSLVFQSLKKSSSGSKTARTVINEIYLNTFRLFLQQESGKFTAYFIIFKYKGFKIYVVFSILNCSEHCGIGSPTISEQSHFIPIRQRTFSNRFNHGSI